MFNILIEFVSDWHSLKLENLNLKSNPKLSMQLPHYIIIIHPHIFTRQVPSLDDTLTLTFSILQDDEHLENDDV